ncbi:MAG: V-type ATPase subunit [Elusimicrobiota bacterium]
MNCSGAMMIEDRSGYLFLIGKVRFLETQILTDADLNRLIENNTEKKLVNDLQDTKYGKYLADYDFNEALEKYIYSCWREFTNKMENTCILDLFMLKRDVLNFINFKKDFKEDKFFAGGVYNLQREEDTVLPGILKKVDQKLKKKSQEKDETIPDGLVEKIFMDFIAKDYIEPLEGGLLKNYWKDMVDINNLLKNVNHETPQDYWAGGNIEQSFWEKVKIESEIPRKLSSKKYMKAIESQKDPVEWELKLEEFLLKYINSMRKITFGPEAAVALLLSLFTEAKNLNMIKAGINLELDKKEIRDNLILGYA